MKPKILAIIPARGGSKGLPRKNVKKLAGKPLIVWTIEAAKQSKYISQVILSSEDLEIIEVAKQYGCDVPFIRPKELAQDHSLGMDVIMHAIEQCGDFDYIVLLQPTSPLRTTEDIDGCIQKLIENRADFCVSVTEAAKSPYWMYTMKDDRMYPLMQQEQMKTRRQDLPVVYALNGAVYVAKTDALLIEKSFLNERTIGYIMPQEKSFDIDTITDFKICEYLLADNNDAS
ncbi:acylneuraminate cytidylyltransferase family protein [Lysinibacillus sp. OL1_EC]|uniref:acylneuraminate cytidylyltransferase family protein n=1 Tax=unclassified Lysinibacillus TaxID=2636778 RepID=UPI00103D88D2|nr:MULTISPECIES: acylneuraminate cytidylyltransferase family protein [unclassified Lysinibacillus]MCM0626391.1 acylneuraminate cytidylyltransferase family protein [Lysinibacillus sp. OL1_EC]TBV85741.1 acylneuraminate cytidylyltransferase family protein [Lysinibacillus sp. OL1]